MEKSEKLEKNERNDIQEIIESLSPNERKILPYLKEKTFLLLCERAKLDETPSLRALEFLSNKKLIQLEIKQTKRVELGINGLLYKQKGLPERRLINLVAEHSPIELEKAKKQSNLSDNEFQAALGALKKKALINLANGNLILSGTKQEISRKTLDEQFLELLPLNFEELSPEQKFSYENLKSRRNIIELTNVNEVKFELTELGKKISKASENNTQELLEALTPEIISKGLWKGKKFRRYDVTSPVPKISGGKRHFVNQAIDHARKVWTQLGFKEMSGNLSQTGFWNFDALFTAQDHPVREIQDTFYIKDIKGKLPSKEIVAEVKKSHEQGVSGSKGWRYSWSEEPAKRVILRTHTTCLSANTIASLRELKKAREKTGDKLREKFFAIGKCFRNETIDWSHGIDFNQTEGIVVDETANFRHLLGYLKEFYRKMGYENVKFVPSFFPYTEPSVEIYAYNNMKKVWIELGGAGIMRPEVVVPLLGEYVPVLAWGPGFDRTIMEYYGIKDLREMYSNDLDQLRKMKFWVK